ncbi:MAG: YceD family protein [Halomonas sp.]|nr:YceD family protein [Halomonas sp.]
MLTTRLPAQVEPYRLAANAEHLEGTVPLEGMLRLSEEAGHQQGECEVRLDFGVDAQGRRFIEGWLRADVELACRRCLEPMPVTVESRFVLGIVSNDAMAANLPGDYEPVLVENEQLNLLSVVEDELILSLPQVIYHDETECSGSRDQLNSGANDESSVAPAASPFDVLRKLKDKK